MPIHTPRRATARSRGIGLLLSLAASLATAPAAAGPHEAAAHPAAAPAAIDTATDIAAALPAAPPGTEIVWAALAHIDTPYRRGGTDAGSGFDCSGFARHVVAQVLGLTLPRRSHEQARAGIVRPVARDALAPGDLVFFNTRRRAHSHVGIYVGGGRFVHAPSPGSAVRIDRLETRYWAQRFDGARRLPAVAADTPG